MQRQEHRDEMRRLLARRDREGLTFAELSDISGVPVSTLSGWSRRFREEAADSSAFTELVVAEDARSDHVGAVPANSSSAGLRVTLPGDIEVHVDVGFDATSLVRVIQAVRAGC